MENYGFVYIWFDRKHKRYYIGSHWGTEADGYVCSSTWMIKAYKIRQEDFKRRILTRVYTNRKDLLESEYRWLSLIKDEEIKSKKYYNRMKHKNGHWTAEDYETDIKKTISEKTKEAMQRPEVREKYLETLKTRNCRSSDPEVREKRRQSMIKTMAEKFPEDNRTKPKVWNEGERKQYYSDKAKKIWATEGHKENVGPKISESLKSLKEVRSKHMSSLRWWNNGSINRRTQTCPGEGWILGRM
jgi:hypothetical protein